MCTSLLLVHMVKLGVDWLSRAKRVGAGEKQQMHESPLEQHGPCNTPIFKMGINKAELVISNAFAR